MSSEQHTGSIAPDESSSDLVIVDDPTSASQSRATNSPVSVAGSTSDHMNGMALRHLLTVTDPSTKCVAQNVARCSELVILKP